MEQTGPFGIASAPAIAAVTIDRTGKPGALTTEVASRQADTFYVDNLKGVGRVYQQTFIDTYAVARPLPSQAPGAPLAEATAPPQ
jgi:hypothetical protein